MSTLTFPPEDLKIQKRRGARRKGVVHCNVTLIPELAEWAKDLPGGLSGTLRRLLREEYERQQAKTRAS